MLVITLVYCHLLVQIVCLIYVKNMLIVHWSTHNLKHTFCSRPGSLPKLSSLVFFRLWPLFKHQKYRIFILQFPTFLEILDHCFDSNYIHGSAPWQSIPLFWSNLKTKHVLTKIWGSLVHTTIVIQVVWNNKQTCEMYAILTAMKTTELEVKMRPEKNSGPHGIWTHDLCATGTVLYQLS